MVPWLAELGRNATGLVDAFRPGHQGLEPRTREELVLAVSAIAGCRFTAWVHQAWRDFLGGEPDDEALSVLMAYARDSALAGRPIDAVELTRVLPASVVRAARATVAAAELSSLVGNTADGLWHRLTRTQRPEPVSSLGEAAVVVAALPVAASLFALAGAMRVTTWIAPPLPVIRRPADEDANLVVHLLADAVPDVLANAAARAVLLRLPAPLVVGVKAEGTAATVRLGREAIDIDNDLAPDIVVVIDGGVELLSSIATRRLGRELHDLSRRPG
jgi:hypothetical protein